MKLPIIKARLRTKLNGPPLSLFNPVPIRKLWLEFGHQYAQTITNKNLVIERIRKRDKKAYTSKFLIQCLFIVAISPNYNTCTKLQSKKSGTFKENMMKRFRKFLYERFMSQLQNVYLTPAIDDRLNKVYEM